MRLGLDIGCVARDQNRTGMSQGVLGLLGGLGRLADRPDVVAYLPDVTPDERARARDALAEAGAPFPVRGYRRLAGRPYRLRQWVAERRAGLPRLDAFLFTAATAFPVGRRRVNAFLIPDLVTVHADGCHTPDTRAGWAEYLDLARRSADLIVTYSEHTKRDVVATYGVPADRVAAVPLAAAADYRPQPEAAVRAAVEPLGLTPGGYVLTVGTLEPRKNHLTLFRAYAQYLALPGVPQLPLVVAGPSGWLYDGILAEPGRLGIADRVRFVGRVPALAPLYAGAAAFVYPSVYEGFGLPPLEAMACGAPTITSDATSLPEVVGNAGLTVPPDDVGGLRDALRRVLTGPGLAADLAARGRARAAEFSWERTAAGYLSALAAAVARKLSHAPAAGR